MTKKTLRQEKLEKMKLFSQLSDKKLADGFLAKLFFNTEEYQVATRIGIVLSMAHEVDTYSIIQHMLSDGKQVFVPETNYQTRIMTFKRLTHLDNIGPDEKGINHVIQNSEISSALDLLVVPGVVFNQSGYRIGYGGGYFDKFLSHNQQMTISLLYDFQLNEFNPEMHDQPVEKLIIATTR
ncbi:5-formyltetrahydrofolate cyclo-ligase [Staphylococcus caeli]|uniref:5-formyltetrahydrofolate cyclo-ligase n=1 Tax=Staphylococcus caeli TaxID=2201815 RepID=A0A1D4GEJ4_9STAP|nr:5-formyltetrahydrofolate cyclo-ligase [Staphylococcus caeli]SCS23346.1 5-formyltetrahydrofolate cyclo-ligase [Staphylococcus caeli]SCT12468.1 5-formyltetrahydrofolate cyclo-ligase [Staphylococcus caeli]